MTCGAVGGTGKGRNGEMNKERKKEIVGTFSEENKKGKK